ncbi:MAG TPA: hypothetical protein VHE55_12665 [Fimbriimonadaceae bacterium]|nr:hypothetical protein [Fimbriimonadaceae bacterium]
MINRNLVIFLGLAGCLHAFGQQLPKLSPATPVDIRVKSVQWHPHGSSLLYSRDEEGGTGIGLYNLGDAEGKVVLHLGPSDKWSAEWFEGAATALVTVYRQVMTAQGPKKEAAIYLLNGKQETSYQVFSRFYNVSDEVSLDCELSPLLVHAIVTVRQGKQTYHMVLPISGGRMIASSDIDQATEQGFAGPAWSKDGTAIYDKGAVQTLETVPENDNFITTTVDSQKAGEVSGTINLVLDKSAKIDLTTADDLTTNIVHLLLKFRPSAPPAGTPVYEVVPANGVLRPVRSPGPWQGHAPHASTMKEVSHPCRLDFGRSSGNSKSLWLMRGEGTNAVGVMVAANADSAEIGPEEKAVEYILDGALFVRGLGSN